MSSGTISADSPYMGSGLTEADINFLRSLPAEQQPEWSDLGELEKATNELERMPSLVEWDEVLALRALLAEVACGGLRILQAGDCAEDPAECTLDHITGKVALLNMVAAVMEDNSRRPVIRVGRIAGQFAKPRSRPTELINGCEFPVFRGHLVNGPEPLRHRRVATPERLVAGYRAARAAFDILRSTVEEQVWTSHEALLLDYELPMLRPRPDGQVFLASTHWPWVGDRTRQQDGAHVAMLSLVANPVACKVGPTADLDELLAVCERLDPLREPGRLTLISRMGAGAVATALPPLVEAVRTAGHPVIWLCDPMHGNTVTGPGGRKTRLLDTVAREVHEFQVAVERAGGIAGGLHLETTPDDVTECVADANHLDEAGGAYTSLCDPRLNPDQAVEIVSTWRS